MEEEKDRGGWIKLHNQITSWEWYKNSNIKAVFLHCLINANYKNNKWQNKLIKRGEFITSLSKMSYELGLTVDQLRYALKQLIYTKEITKQSTNKFTKITVCNYDTYNTFILHHPKQSPKQSPKPIPTTKNKKNKKKNNICSESTEIPSDFLLFWSLYEKKTTKRESLKFWNTLREEEKKEILRCVPKYVQLKKDKNFRKDPIRFLRNRMWEDEYLLEQFNQLNLNSDGKQRVEGF